MHELSTSIPNPTSSGSQLHEDGTIYLHNEQYFWGPQHHHSEVTLTIDHNAFSRNSHAVRHCLNCFDPFIYSIFYLFLFCSILLLCYFISKKTKIKKKRNAMQ